MNIFDAAPVYSREFKWCVLPLAPLGKIPCIKDWVNAASSDLETIAQWAVQFPNANVGIATGSKSGFFVLDVDPDNGGLESLAKLEAQHGPLPLTAKQRTGSGGLHFLFQTSDFPISNSAGKFGPGLDIRGDGGQIVVAPSVSAKGPYKWVNAPWDVAPVPAPEWLLELLRPRHEASPTPELPRMAFPPATAEELEAARTALDEHGPAIEGHGGDAHTWQAAAILRSDFALTEPEAWQLLCEWNAGCQPPWGESDLKAKLRGGEKYASGTYGCKRKVDALALVKQELSRWRIAGEPDEGIVPIVVKARRLVTELKVDTVVAGLIERELVSSVRLQKSKLAIPKGRVLQARGMTETAASPTEDSVATLFETEFENKLRYCKQFGVWFEYQDTHWQRENTDLAFHFCREVARTVNPEKKSAVSKASFARGVESFLRASRTFATLPSDWDRNEFDLNTTAGVVDLRNGNLRPHEPSDYITRCTQVEPLAGPMPTFEKFMTEICCGDQELVAYLQTAIGAALSGARVDHWLQFWSGEGRNGKNTLGDLVQWILGSYAKTIPVETLMSSKSERHPTELANLLGVRIATSSEVPEGSHWNESRIKSLTGDATISARFMRGDFFEYERTHKHVVYGNHRPQLRVVDKATTERLHVVPFRATFTAELGNVDVNLPAKLKAEAPAILAWLIEGHLRWFATGSLRKCAAVQRETTDYLESQSTPEMWLLEKCCRAPSLKAKSSVLYQDYSTWKELRGESPMSQTRWGEFMSARFLKAKSHGSTTYLGVQLLNLMELSESTTQ